MFEVKCEKVKRSPKYKIEFPYNQEIIDIIRLFDKKDRKWVSTTKHWELNPMALFTLISHYKGSNKIFFNFGSDENKLKYIEDYKKAKEKVVEEEKERQELEINKKRWLAKKEDFEENYREYQKETHENLKDEVQLYPFQIAGTEYLNTVRNVLLAFDMGLGKAQSLDCKLITPDGYKLMGDIKFGDMVIGDDGKPTEVLGVYPQGEKEMYEVVFNDGSRTECCKEHLWNVNTPDRNSKKRPFKTQSLEKILNDGLTCENGNRKHYIPITKPVEFNEKDVLINPYILGCILGDGGITQDNIIISNPETELINEIRTLLPENHTLINKPYLKDIDYVLTNTINIRENIINKSLREYDLMGKSSYTKFIPNDYKYNSVNVRLEILRGLLDTDGHATKKDGMIEITLASLQMINDLKDIVQSLGGIGRLHEKWVNYNGENRLYYRLYIKLPPKFEPFKLSRKLNNFKKPTKYKPNRGIKEINPVGKKQAQCIMVDNESSLYLTDEYIVTHNTVISIAYTEMNQNYDTVLVVTPNSLKFNYFNEVNKFTDSKAHIIKWKNNIHTVDESKYIIVNYEYFNPSNIDATQKKFWDYIGKDRKLDTVVFDESHRLKNSKSNTYKSIKKLLNKKTFKNKKKSTIFMSGTPAPNAAHELYTVLNQISPIDFATKTHFYEYYCGMTYNYDGYGYETNIGNQKLEELFHKISPYVYRKKKVDVLDLPDKIYQNVMLEMSPKEQKLYDEIADDVANEIFTSSNSNPLTILVRLRQYTSLLKIKYISDIIDSVIESGEKLVIVDSFKPILKELKEKYNNISELHTGDIKDMEVRAKMVERFQDVNSSISLFLASIQTANYGLTLTAASKMIVNTIPYSVGELDQVVDRIFRIGQDSTVNIYFPIFKDTIDEMVYDRIESKRKEINKVIDNEDYESVRNDSLLNDVLNDFKKKYKR